MKMYIFILCILKEGENTKKKSRNFERNNYMIMKLQYSLKRFKDFTFLHRQELGKLPRKKAEISESWTGSNQCLTTLLKNILFSLIFALTN